MSFYVAYPTKQVLLFCSSCTKIYICIKICMKLENTPTNPWPSPPMLFDQASHRLEKYLNIQDCLEKSLKIKFALKST